MGQYHQLTPEQRAWAESHLNKKQRLSTKRYGMAVDYKPDLSGVGVYLQVLKPTVRVVLGGEPEYVEIWKAFPKELASRRRPKTRGDNLDYADEYIDWDGEDEEEGEEEDERDSA